MTDERNKIIFPSGEIKNFTTPSKKYTTLRSTVGKFLESSWYKINTDAAQIFELLTKRYKSVYSENRRLRDLLRNWMMINYVLQIIQDLVQNAQLCKRTCK